MPSFEPFPIYDFKAGLKLDKDPWLKPADAFSKLYDWYIYQGVLQKRKGHTLFSSFVHVNPSAFGEGKFGEGKFGMGRKATNPGNAIMGIYNYYKGITEKLLIMDTLRINRYNTVSKRNDDLTVLQLPFKLGEKEILPGDVIAGAISGDTASVDAVVWDNGTWAGGDAHGTLIISGASQGDFNSEGENITVNGVTAAFAKESATYDEFTGDDTNFFWFENWRDVGYFTNNINQIRKFDDNYSTRLNIDLDVEGGPDNDVNTCLLIFHIKNRILLLNTVERGEAFYQRARWSQIVLRGQAVVFRDDDYSDADRDDMIVGADFIGNELVVLFESGAMKLLYTGDPDIPFKWDNIPSQEGCYATMSLSAFSDEITCVGRTRFIGCDGREVYGVDEKIPDLMLNFNQSAVEYCFSMVLEELRLILTSYAKAGSDKPDEALMLNYEENSFAIFRLPIHSMGYSSLETTLSTDDMVGISLDDLDYSLDDKELQAGYPTNLMGCRDGNIFKMFDGGADNGAAIECEVEGSEWNPYTQEGRKAILGWIDFLVDKNDNASFDVEFYINTENSPYKTETVECAETGTLRDKVYKRVYCGAEGEFHKINLGNNAANNRPRIHAIVPWFRRGGPI
jgi:hypothetical protein